MMISRHISRSHSCCHMSLSFFSGIQSLFFHVQMDMLCVWTVLKSTAQQNLMTDSLCTVILMGTLYLALEAQVRFYQTVFIKSVLYKNACFP